jgi:hypothetical protein
MQQYGPTDAQKKAFEENEADFRRFDEQISGIRETARARLENSGWDPGQNDAWALSVLLVPWLRTWRPAGKMQTSQLSTSNDRPRPTDLTAGHHRAAWEIGIRNASVTGSAK